MIRVLSSEQTKRFEYRIRSLRTFCQENEGKPAVRRNPGSNRADGVAIRHCASLFGLCALNTQDWSSSPGLTSTNVSLLTSPQPDKRGLCGNRRRPSGNRPFSGFSPGESGLLLLMAVGAVWFGL